MAKLINNNQKYYISDLVVHRFCSKSRHLFVQIGKVINLKVETPLAPSEI